jgi:hypothetical protein
MTDQGIKTIGPVKRDHDDAIGFSDFDVFVVHN